MNPSFNIQTCNFVCVTDIVPKEWTNWFFDMLSEDSPFSWGDNNRSLVSVERFSNFVIDQLNDILIDNDNENLTEDDIENFEDILDELQKKNVYIDLEN